MAYGGCHAQSTDYKACEQFRLQQAATDSSDYDHWPYGFPRPGQSQSVDAAIAYANEPVINPGEIDWLKINEEFS